MPKDKEVVYRKCGQCGGNEIKCTCKSAETETIRSLVGCQGCRNMYSSKHMSCPKCGMPRQG